MYSSRMRTVRSLTIFGVGGACSGGVPSPGGVSAGGVPAQGVLALGEGVCWGVSAQEEGVPCDLSHHAFDVTCMLSCHQLRLFTSAAAYIVFGHVTCGACWDTTPPPVDRMTDTCKNITFANFVCGR